MLVVGKVGWGQQSRITKLTSNEQLSHVTLWCMVAAPLLIGCDMTQMDKFTTDLLTNGEVLDIDQDQLGIAAVKIRDMNGEQVWARPLFDGTVAVALFNLSGEAAKVHASWSDFKKLRGIHPHALPGIQPVRDLWKHQDLEACTDYESVIPRHGCVLLKVGKIDNSL